jgi:hypothetical protein
MNNTPPKAKTRALARMALTGLNMKWVLPVTLDVWPFLARMGAGWDPVLWMAAGVVVARPKMGSGHQRPRWRVCGTRAMT